MSWKNYLCLGSVPVHVLRGKRWHSLIRMIYRLLEDELWRYELSVRRPWYCAVAGGGKGRCWTHVLEEGRVGTGPCAGAGERGRCWTCAGNGGEGGREGWDPEKGAVSAGSERTYLLAKDVPVRGNFTGVRVKENCHNITTNYALQPGTHVPRTLYEPLASLLVSLLWWPML